MDPCQKQWNNCIHKSTTSYDISKDKIDTCKQDYNKCKISTNRQTQKEYLMKTPDQTTCAKK